MKNYLLLFIIIGFGTKFLGQNTLQVVDAETKKPLSKVNVYCNDELVGKTNAKGTLVYKTKCKTIDVQRDDYDEKTVSVEKNMTIALQESSEKSKKIQAIAIRNASDPKALRILDKVVKKYKENSPKSLDGYRFKKYSKISIDVDQDSLASYRAFVSRRADSLAQIGHTPKKQTEKDKKDSLMTESFFNIAKESNFFLWEKAEEYKFSKRHGEKIVVLDNRMSGFKDPIYEFMALGISNLDRIPRQVNPDNRHLYRFFLSDTIMVEGRRTFVINFRELSSKQKQKSNKFAGSVFIDTETFAIKKITSHSTKRNQSTVTSVWKPMAGKWFLDTEDIRFRIGHQEFETGKKEPDDATQKSKSTKKKFGNYAFVTHRFFDVEINPEQKAEEFHGYTYSIQNAEGNQLEKYRTAPLTEREAKTYQGIDSLVQKYDIERKVKALTSLLRGQIRVGKVNILPNRIFSYNPIEKFRLGIGLKANEKFSPIYSPDLYLGYGFGDGKLKYGVGLDTRLSSIKTSVFRLEYVNDMKAFGRFNRNLWPQSIAFIEGAGGSLYHPHYLRYQGVGASYLYDITNTLTARFSAHYQKQNPVGDYQFNGNTTNDYHDTQLALTIKYSPKDKNMMTPQGKYTYHTGYPHFFINIEKGINALGGNMNYTKADFLAIHSVRTRWGTSRAYLYGGISSGSVPLWKNFEITGNTSSSESLWHKLNFATSLSHYAMFSGTFYADQFLGFQYRHTLPFIFSMGKRHSRLSLGYNAVWGNFKNPRQHNISFDTPKNVYQEVGITWNNFLGTIYHIGLYHRVGHYTSTKTVDNIGITLGLGL